MDIISINADAEQSIQQIMIPEYASQIESTLTQLVATFRAIETEWHDPVECSFKSKHIDEIENTVDSALRGGNIRDIIGIKDLLVRLDNIMQKMSSLSEMPFNVIRTDQSARNRKAPNRSTYFEDYTHFNKEKEQKLWSGEMTRKEIDDINEGRAKNSY